MFGKIKCWWAVWKMTRNILKYLRSNYPGIYTAHRTKYGPHFYGREILFQSSENEKPTVYIYVNYVQCDQKAAVSILVSWDLMICESDDYQKDISRTWEASLKIA